MIVKAKDKANDAFDLLFQKDSNLSQVKDLKDAILAQKNTPPEYHSEKIKLGTLRVSGLLPLKKVVNLTDSNLKDFRSNLAVFAH
jgi:hypothetical protein